MIKLQTLCGVALTVAATSCFATQAQAAEELIPDAFNRATFAQSDDTFQSNGIDRQFTMLLGLSYPDNNVVSDARSIDTIYQDLIRQRVGTPIRTRDLPDPFSSLLNNPAKVNAVN
ncbi:hypothetical protein [Chamaesiphon sp. OTE_75_metabat_556]|uniref:hypothetical protein n=1 Tax=Chamaesiphon sp. OTE_75_metabat_556 TaxID=2964692 RepID=UPI00286BEA38|nr:hypothetical protein [Chamaesiphon sp. OTE_75_metabat_556]